jgi:hypothetical protein
MTRLAGDKLLCLPYDTMFDLAQLVRNESAALSSPREKGIVIEICMSIPNSLEIVFSAPM